MMSDLTLNMLRMYPEAAGYSQAHLRKIILWLPWHLNGVVGKAEMKLTKFMRRAAASWMTLSISLGRSPETTIRNLIAAAKSADLPIYRLILRWTRRNCFHPFNMDFEELEEMLPEAALIDRLVECVLYHRVRPSEADLKDLFRNDPRRMVTIILSNYRDQKLDLGELLSAAIDLCGPDDARIASAAMGVLLQIKRRRKLPASIDEQKFAILPEVWRRAVLFSPARRYAFLLSKFRQTLESNPRNYADMPESIRFRQSCNKALVAISSGHFGNKGIEELLANRVEFLWLSGQVAEALSKAEGLAKSYPPIARYAKPALFLHNETALALVIRCTGGEIIGSPAILKRQSWIAPALQILPDAGIVTMLLRSDAAIQSMIFNYLQPERSRAIQRQYDACLNNRKEKRGCRASRNNHSPSFLAARNTSCGIAPS